MPEGIRKKRELTADQNRLLAWLSSPKDERAPETLEALAQELGVNPRTLQRWRTKLDLDAVAAERARRRLLESLPTVYRVLAEKAEEGNHRHMKLYLGVATQDPTGKVGMTAEGRRSGVAGKLRGLTPVARQTSSRVDDLARARAS